MVSISSCVFRHLSAIFKESVKIEEQFQMPIQVLLTLTVIVTILSFKRRNVICFI